MPNAAAALPGGTPSPAPQSKAKSSKRYPHSFWWYLKWFFITLQLIIFCLIVVTVCVGKGLYDQLNKIVPDTRFITSRTKAEPTRVYAADGSLLAEFKGEQRSFVPLEQLKVQRTRKGKSVTELGHLINATLSIEDARFYSHPGMDTYRIGGAVVANFKNPDGIQQGGSTITEQLAVNIYLTRTKTLARRLQTALLALQLERRFSKDEILELYLNEIYYGNRAYGCEAAAQRYFGKSSRKLTIAQSALLAGLPQQPTRLDPFLHFDRAKKRQRLVLRAMLENKKINYGQYQQALKDASLQTQLQTSRARFLTERTTQARWRSPYFVAYVKQYLQRNYDWSDDFLNKGGLKIFTTLDPKIQATADRVMNSNLRLRGGSGGDKPLQGALVCIDPNTGHIVAMYGGRDYYSKISGQFNRATQAKRQPGSTFKPFIYATAMEQNYSPDTIIVDKPTKIGDKLFKNYDHDIIAHHGAMTFRTALATSNNTAAVRLLMKLGTPDGIQNVIQKAHLMGITSPLQPYPALALGASDITPLENTSAYGVFATRGLRADATPVTRVDNYAGETLIEQAVPIRAARVLSIEAGNRMWDMLRSVVTNGTGKNAQIPRVEVIGKTGTTSNNKDVWFMGATSKLVTGVWMGYDKPKELYGSAGGRWCAPAWRSFMIQALDIYGKRNPTEKLVEDARATQLQRLKAAQFKKYVSVRICRESGLLATSNCPDTAIAKFSAAAGANGGAPTSYCDIHGARKDARPLSENNGASTPQAGDLGFDGNQTGSGEVQTDGGGTTIDDGADTRDAVGAPDGDATGERGAAAPVRAPNRAQSTEVALSPAEGVESRSEDGEVTATVCAESGLLAKGSCPVTLQQFFLASQVPRRRCDLHR